MKLFDSYFDPPPCVFRTVVVESSTGKELFAEDLPKTAHILFSPRDRVMVTFEPFVIYGTRFNDDGTEKKPAPNLRFWSIGERRLLCTLTAKKQVCTSV